MKTFWITLLSLCLLGGLYAQDEAVNDTVYMTVNGTYAQMTLVFSQLPSSGVCGLG